jgi:NAD(P)H-hydrate epimerase
VSNNAGVGVIRGYSAEQVRAAEAPHLASGEPLMQRAAAGLADEIRRVLDVVAAGRSGRVLLLVGSGNNGADTLYAGAELASEEVDVIIVAAGSRIHEEALAAAIAAGATREDGFDLEDAGVDVIVDGILGTGTSANPALRGIARKLVASILPVLAAPLHPIVIAVDLPSGINPDDGTVPDALVLPADTTVTFGAFKAGLLQEPASRLAGRIHLVDIGLAPDLEAVEPILQVEG